MSDRTYIAIDMKSFFASVECVARGLDPLTTNLVVADITRTDKTICLAVSPSLKSYGIAGRARLFEVIRQVKSVNLQRLRNAPGRKFTCGSSDNTLVQKDPSVALEYIVAPPRMARYMEASGKAYETYLKYVAPEDIFSYSIDEVFIDATVYLKTYSCTAHELAMRMIRAVLKTTGVTATAGIGSNMFLAKVAMDIKAKHMPADRDGVRIAELDEMSFRREMWGHVPLTDFWRIGRGTASRLEKAGISTMGELARRSLDKSWEAWLYRQFGVNAELVIDHAWGYEPCTMEQVKAYRPETNSISTGQVLPEPYSFEKGRLIVCEMADNLALDLVSKHVKTDQIVLTIGYDVENVSSATLDLVSDWYGRIAPKPAHGSSNLGRFSSSTALVMEAACSIFDSVVDRKMTIRRINITANHVCADSLLDGNCQSSIFDDIQDDTKERRVQESILEIKRRFGKNAILKGMNFEDGATAKERNAQIGGHKA